MHNAQHTVVIQLHQCDSMQSNAVLMQLTRIKDAELQMLREGLYEYPRTIERQS